MSKGFWFCITFWIIFTLARVLCHQPWSDEANAWELARSFEFGSILESIKYQGHFFVWYFILLPFAKFDFAYPYSMLLINWAFCFVALVVLWRFAPFNNWIKGLMTFSFPFFTYYPVVARCYSIGILLLFALCALYKDRLKHPIWYANIVFICANTSLMACIGALIFGGILLFDLFKQKQNKDLKICLGIAVTCILMLLVQVLNVKYGGRPDDKIRGLTLDSFLLMFPLFPKFINAIFIGIFVVGFGISLFKDKLILMFLSVIYGFLLMFFHFCYAGDFWHWYFLYIYLICACWLALDRNVISDKFKKATVILLGLLTVMFFFELRYEIRVFQSNSKNIAEFIKENRTARFVYFDIILKSTLPYLHDADYDLAYYEYSNRQKDNVEFEKAKEYLASDKETYFLWSNCDEIEEIKGKNGEIIKLFVAKNFQNTYCIYKTEFIKNK